MSTDQPQYWYWKCPTCQIPEQPCTQSEAMKLADQHDADKHKKKPLTCFGYQTTPVKPK